MLLKHAEFKYMHLNLGVLWICRYMNYHAINVDLMKNFDYSVL